MNSLQGKTALVTGASRGIGKAIAVTLAREGAAVIVNYNGSAEKAEETVREITENGGSARAVQCSVEDAGAVRQMIDGILETERSLDILVNNAGITRDGLLAAMTEEQFVRVIDVNLKGCFHCLQAVSRQMIRQRSGCIVNISSYSGVCGNAGQVNYAASKAGIIGMTKSAAKELGARNIRVNAIAPGFIETEMTAVLSDRVRDEVKKNIAMRTFGKPEDVAELAAFLCTDGARYITGQVIGVDGGLS